MIHWAWLIVAVSLGACFGVMIVAVLAAGAQADMDRDVQRWYRQAQNESKVKND